MIDWLEFPEINAAPTPERRSIHILDGEYDPDCFCDECETERLADELEWDEANREYERSTR